MGWIHGTSGAPDRTVSIKDECLEKGICFECALSYFRHDDGVAELNRFLNELKSAHLDSQGHILEDCRGVEIPLCDETERERLRDMEETAHKVFEELVSSIIPSFEGIVCEECRKLLTEDKALRYSWNVAGSWRDTSRGHAALFGGSKCEPLCGAEAYYSE